MSKSLTAKYFSYIAVLYFIGNAYILGNDRYAGRNSWLALLICASLYIPVLLIYARLAEEYPQMEFFEMCGEIFGRKITVCLAAIYAVYGVFLLSMSMSCLSRFVSADILPETPKIFMAITVALCSVLLVYCGEGSMGKWAAFILPGVFAVMLAAMLISVKSFDFENLLPVELDENTLIGAYRYSAFPFGEPIVILSLVKNVKDGIKPRHFILPWIIASLILALTFMRNTLVLGGALSGIIGFSTFRADSVAGYNGIGQRIEAFTSMIPAISAVMEASVVLLFMVQAVRYITKRNRTFITALILSCIGAVLCMALYTNNILLEERAMLWPVFSIPMQILIPFLMLIICIIRRTILQKRR